jgi:hypothetical protein
MYGDDQFIKEHEKYFKQKKEYLLNKKPERYKLYTMGLEGFIIHDTLKYKNNEDKEGYLLMPSFKINGDIGYRTDKRFNTPQELVDELNYLDFQVNGNLYDDYYHILSNKTRIYREINSRLNVLLDDVVTNESFTVSLYDYPSEDLLKIKVKVSKEGLEDIGGHPFLDNIIINTFFQTINEYEDELLDENKDILIELKMRLLETLQKEKLPLL